MTDKMYIYDIKYEWEPIKSREFSFKPPDEFKKLMTDPELCPDAAATKVTYIGYIPIIKDDKEQTDDRS